MYKMSSNNLTTKLYRILLKEARLIQNHIDKTPILQRKLDPRNYGQANMFDLPNRGRSSNLEVSSNENDILKFFESLLPRDDDEESDEEKFKYHPSGPEQSLIGINYDLLKASIRKGFKSDDGSDIVASQGKAIAAIRELQTQAELCEQTSIHMDEKRNIVCVATGR